MKRLVCLLSSAVLVALVLATPVQAAPAAGFGPMAWLDWVANLVNLQLAFGDSGPTMDPSGLTDERGPTMDPSGLTGERGPAADPSGLVSGPTADPNGLTGERGATMDPSGLGGDTGASIDPHG